MAIGPANIISGTKLPGGSSLRAGRIWLSYPTSMIMSETVLRRALAERRRGDLTVFEMPMYRGCANKRVRGVTWDKGPRLIEYGQFPGGQRLRMTKLSASARLQRTMLGPLHARAWNWFNIGVAAPIRVVPDSGWHITGMGNWEAWRRKVSSFSHTELKAPLSYESQEAYAAMIANETDLVPIEQMPAFIQQNPERFVLA